MTHAAPLWIDFAACLVVGVLVACGTYLMFDGRLRRVILGVLLVSHAANISLILLARRPDGFPPILAPGAAQYVDPLPQALILTAIVIGMGVAAFLLTLIRRMHEEKVETVNDAVSPESDS